MAGNAHPKSVRYIGIYGIRQVTRAEWEAAGVVDQDTVQWNARNRWTVQGNKLNADAIEVLEFENQFVFDRPDSAPEPVQVEEPVKSKK